MLGFWEIEGTLWVLPVYCGPPLHAPELTLNKPNYVGNLRGGRMNGVGWATHKNLGFREFRGLGFRV